MIGLIDAWHRPPGATRYILRGIRSQFWDTTDQRYPFLENLREACRWRLVDNFEVRTNAPEGLYFYESSIDAGENHPFAFGKSFS